MVPLVIMASLPSRYNLNLTVEFFTIDNVDALRISYRGKLHYFRLMADK